MLIRTILRRAGRQLDWLASLHARIAAVCIYKRQSPTTCGVPVGTMDQLCNNVTYALQCCQSTDTPWHESHAGPGRCLSVPAVPAAVQG